jgi:hypothetical protein
LVDFSPTYIAPPVLVALLALKIEFITFPASSKQIAPPELFSPFA